MKEVTFSVTRVLQAPTNAVWHVLADFGTEHKWSESLVHCERDTIEVAVGTVRTCTLPRPLMGRTYVREQLTEYEPLSVLAYKLDGAAGPFAAAQSRWTTRSIPNGTTALVVEGKFVPRDWFSSFVVWPLAKPLLRRLTKQVMRELEEYVLKVT
jgi:uncharacterized protein YndB with AHSA1/START domain